MTVTTRRFAVQEERSRKRKPHNPLKRDSSPFENLAKSVPAQSLNITSEETSTSLSSPRNESDSQGRRRKRHHSEKRPRSPLADSSRRWKMTIDVPDFSSDSGSTNECMYRKGKRFTQTFLRYYGCKYKGRILEQDRIISETTKEIVGVNFFPLSANSSQDDDEDIIQEMNTQVTFNEDIAVVYVGYSYFNDTWLPRETVVRDMSESVWKTLKGSAHRHQVHMYLGIADFCVEDLEDQHVLSFYNEFIERNLDNIRLKAKNSQKDKIRRQSIIREMQRCG